MGFEKVKIDSFKQNFEEYTFYSKFEIEVRLFGLRFNTIGDFKAY